MIEVVRKIKLLKVNKLEEAATGVDKTIKKTVTEVKADHMTRVFITFDTIPRGAIITSYHPQRDLRICKRSIRCGPIEDKAFFELQQGKDLNIMAQWLPRRYKRKQRQQKKRKRMSMNKEGDKPITFYKMLITLLFLFFLFLR